MTPFHIARIQLDTVITVTDANWGNRFNFCIFALTRKDSGWKLDSVFSALQCAKLPIGKIDHIKKPSPR